jgi:hypothetical protein
MIIRKKQVQRAQKPYGYTSGILGRRAVKKTFKCFPNFLHEKCESSNEKREKNQPNFKDIRKIKKAL